MWQSHSLLSGLLQYLAKNMALLVQKLWGGKKLSKSVFGYFKNKKMPLNSGGGVEALMARPLRKLLFLMQLPLKITSIGEKESKLRNPVTLESLATFADRDPT